MSADQARSKKNKQSTDIQEGLVAGSSWMTMGSFISRLMGALYIIPWMAWMGDAHTANAAHALFQVGYTYYGLLLNLATAGIPSAISQQIAHYNSLGEYEISKNIYRRGLQIMMATGVVTAGILYFFAPQFSAQSPTASISDRIIVIRSLVPALLIIPSMSVTRGFVQGHGTMAPSAVSQIIEQFARVIFMLASVFIIRQIMSGEPLLAVSLSTFAAFIGAAFSYIYLVVRIKQNDTVLNRDPSESRNEIKISTNHLMGDIIKSAVPFIVIASGISMAQLIDQNTYDSIMNQYSNLTALQIQDTYAISHASANKLIMLLVSFGTSIAIASVPLLTQLVSSNDKHALRQQIENTILLLFFIMLPAAIGMGVLAEPVYAVFYGHSDFGTSITQISTIVAVLWSSYVVLSNIMKVVGHIKAIMLTLLGGMLLKLAIQVPFVSRFGAFGMHMTTIISFTIICGITIYLIHERVGLDMNRLVRRLLLLMILSAVMGLVTWFTRLGLGQLLQPEGRVAYLVILGLSAVVGGSVYGYLTLKTRLAEKLLGPKFERLRKKLRIS